MIYLRLALLGGALIAGWMACSWYRDSKALDDFEAALKVQTDLFNETLAQQNALYEAEVQKSLTLEKQNASLRQTVGALREEIDHATFTPSDDGVCRHHPVTSPEFHRLYDAAARGGAAEAGAGDSGGVSPRDD